MMKVDLQGKLIDEESIHIIETDRQIGEQTVIKPPTEKYRKCPMT